MSLLDNAIEAIKAGQYDAGRKMLEQMLEEDENNEQVWLWMSAVVDSDDDREICLENVLALDPENMVAKNALEAVKNGEFNPRDIIGEDVVAEEEDDFSEMTFHDQFFSDEDFDNELELPSVMGGSPEPKIKEQKGASKRGPAINMRLVLLGVLGLIIVAALGAAAVYNIFLSGDSSTTEQPVQQAPAGGGAEGGPPPDTPTPEPTSTPTETPFVLPTPKPTDEPTPTATQVVSPTTARPTETPTITE